MRNIVVSDQRHFGISVPVVQIPRLERSSRRLHPQTISRKLAKALNGLRRVRLHRRFL
ncbi:MAG: hypothetical protein Q7S29_03050 [Candidatus Peribacter sp.]|nr:hypothetical protein [Candidatus Peribacter sp.]